MTQAKDPPPDGTGDRTRTLGLLAGGGALAVALAVAVFGGGEGKNDVPAPVAVEQGGAVEAPPSHIAAPSGSAIAPVPGAPTADIAMVEGPRPPVSIPAKPVAPVKQAPPVENPDLEFLVRFDERHPLYRAQALYLQGKRQEAETEARAIVPLRPELRGLCFARFTLGAEIVLSACDPVSKAQAQRVSDRFERKIRAIRGVQYVDANVVVQPEARTR